MAVDPNGKIIVYPSDQDTKERGSRRKNDRSQFVSVSEITGTSNETDLGDRIISGYAVWKGGLLFESNQLFWEIGGSQFSSDGDQITLTDADPTLSRIDVIAVDDTGAFTFVTGTPAADPAKPALLPSQLEVTFVSIPALSTSPTGYSTEDIFLENAGQPAEWDATESTSGARITIPYTDNPITGSNSIRVANPNTGDLITFTHDTAIFGSDFYFLEMDILIGSDWKNDYITVQLFNSTTEIVSFSLSSSNLDMSNTTTAQKVRIFNEDFGITQSQSFDIIKIYHRDQGQKSVNYILDNVTAQVVTGIGVDSETGGGGLPIAQKTGNTMVFTEDAFYNESAYLTSGNITIDGTDAVVGATVWQHCDSYVPTIAVAGSEVYRISGATPSTDKVNIYKITYNGQFYDVVVDVKTYLTTPTVSITASDAQNALSFAVANATSYTIKFNTVDNEGTASSVPGYDGTSTTYNHTGLVNGTTYYYYVNAFGNGYEDSLTGTGNGTPSLGYYRLYIGGVGGTITTATILATYLELDDASALNAGTNLDATDIANFSVDANNNIYGEILVDYRLGYQAFNINADITYFIDLDGGMASTNHNGFQACTSLKYFYSPSAAIRSNQTLGRNFRNIQTTFELIYAPADPVIGTAAATNNEEYDLLTTGIEIFAHPDAETNNGGGVEADIANAISQKSAVVTYCSDTASVPDAVSDLSGTNITSTTVDLTFSTPTSTNPILKYEVWVDGAFWDWITASGGTVSGLTTATNYNIQIKTADDQYNISVLSNTYNFTTL